MSSLVALPDPLREIVETRVEELLRFRHWYRAHPQIKLGGLEAVHNAELRALVRLLRAARLQEKADTVWHAPAGPLPPGGEFGAVQTGHGLRPIVTRELVAGWAAPEAADPVTAGKAYHDWQTGR